jgi:hypothetical protein
MVRLESPSTGRASPEPVSCVLHEEAPRAMAKEKSAARTEGVSLIGKTLNYGKRLCLLDIREGFKGSPKLITKRT